MRTRYAIPLTCFSTCKADSPSQNAKLSAQGGGKRRRTSGDSIVLANTRLSKSPTKNQNLFRLSALNNKRNEPNIASTSDKLSAFASNLRARLNGNKSLEKNGQATKIPKIKLPWLEKAPNPLTSRAPAEAAAGALEAASKESTSIVESTERPMKVPRSRKAKKAVSTGDSRARAETNARTDSAQPVAAILQDTPEPDTKSTMISTKKYQGKWTTTVTGPKADDKQALKSKAPKNVSSRPEDKLWDCEHEPKPLTRAKALRAGVDVDDAAQVTNCLTMRFSLKDDPETKMVILYDPPADWDDQEEVTSLIKTMNQHRRREAGAKSATRHPYTSAEVDYLVKQFQGNKSMRGANAMSENKKWEELTADFNKQFSKRTTHVASRGEATVGVGERSWHAIMALCDRKDAILAAREMSTTKTTGKRKARDAELNEDEVEEKEDTVSPPPKRRRPAKKM